MITNCVVVRTKLQAIIVKKMVEEKLIVGELHIVQIHENDGDNSRADVTHQCHALSPVTRKITVLSRQQSGVAGLFIYFWFILLKSRLLNQRVYFANINWVSFALALKLSPGQRIFSFDDGSANIQHRKNSYLSTSPTAKPGLGGRIARWLFPDGCASFVRTRIERHCTIYPGIANIVPASKMDAIEVDWSKMIPPDVLPVLPKRVTKIFLGSVYPEIVQRSFGPVSREEIEHARAWADLHIPHPRSPDSRSRPGFLLRSPAEAIISHYARLHRVTVAHYNSSAVLPFAKDSRVRLVDLMEVPVSSLEIPLAIP